MAADGSIGRPCPGLSLEEVIVDSFAGAGGASEGIEQATGSNIGVAINHDPVALAIHEANHGKTTHLIESVWGVKEAMLRGIFTGLLVGLLWASFDCRDFSKAKGGKPLSRKVRGLCWWVLRALDIFQPRVVIGENVEEFRFFGPLLPNNKRCPKRKGRSFKRWLKGFERRGYKVEWRILKACDYGAPTKRKRLYFIARRDGQPIVWPEPTHGPGRALPWRTAAECIDWDLPMHSIFTREARGKEPLADATLRRIAKGAMKFAFNPKRKPYLVAVRHHGGGHIHDIDAPMVTVPASDRELALATPVLTQYNGTGIGSHVGEPLGTATTVDRFGLAIPILTQTGYGERKTQAARVLDLFAPLGTVVSEGVKHGVAAFHIVRNVSDRDGGGWAGGTSITDPLGTVTTSSGAHALLATNLVILRNNCDGADMREPMPAICASGNHVAAAAALLVRFNPELAAHIVDGALHVFIDGIEYIVVDILFRMLEPRELARAQGFPESYVLDPIVTTKIKSKKTGKERTRTAPVSKKAQVRGIGNSVCPPVARALVEANFATPIAMRRAA